ncbi:uncharacterized protein TNCV_4352031 [Trichonephila clavipes]|nr:uncharacterized protein TNCV_4352031 [Trichonephila clavipes]
MVGTETVEEVSTAVVERTSISLYSSASDGSLSRKLNSVVDMNTQNFRIWGTSPPNILHQQPLHSDYVTAWSGLNAELILGPFFFETLTSQGPKRCSVTSPRYSELLQQQVIPTSQERQCLQTTIFMQDGATPHIGHRVKTLLSANFGDKRDYPDISGCMAFSLIRLKPL